MNRWITFLLLLSGLRPAPAQPVKVAVAANAQFVLEQVSKAFEGETGLRIERIVSSSGKLTAQIRNGAPFALFLSADTKYPQELHQAGFGAAPPKIYAYGALVLWTTGELDLARGLKLLTQPSVTKIAVANPKLAPYGEAALAALRHEKLYDQLAGKLVYGESIAQVNQYVLAGAATVGLTAKSVVLDPALRGKGHWVDVNPKAYRPIAQSAILLKNATPAARKFYDFLFGQTAKNIFKQYGYTIQ